MQAFINFMALVFLVAMAWHDMAMNYLTHQNDRRVNGR